MEKMKIKRSNSDSSSMSDFCLDRLFDPEQLYYTPMEDLIKKYKTRKLLPGRMYNLAKKYGHVTKIRTRIINAPQMERANIRILGTENFYYPPPKVQLCTDLNIKINAIEYPDDSSETDTEEKKELSYKEWLSSRKTLRKSLNGFDLNVDYLKRKKNLSDIEKRILRRMMFTEIGIQTDPIKETNPKKRTKSSETPKIEYPPPILMEKIEDFLEENKWRLIDLFKDLDKDKDWLILKSDLSRQCLKGRLKANDSMIEELVVALGSSDSNSLNYKSLLSGRLSHLLKKRQDDSVEIFDDDFIPKELQTNRSTSKSSKRKNNTSVLSVSNKSFSLEQSQDSNTRTSSSKSKSSNNSHYLQLPKIDLKPTYFPNNFVDKEVSVNSMSAYKTITISKDKENKQKNEQINEIKSKMDNMRMRTSEDLEAILNKPDLLNMVDARKLQKALDIPRQKDHKEMMMQLKMIKKKQIHNKS